MGTLEDAATELAETQRLAHLGSWRFDLPTGARTWSDEMLRIYGLEPGTPPPTREQQQALMDPLDYQVMEEGLAAVVAGGKDDDLQYRIHRADGTTRWVIGRAERILDADGQFIGIRGTVMDVTELAEARAALAASGDRFRLLAENASDVVLLISQDAVTEWVSPSVTDLLGWLPDDLVGRTVYDLAHPDDRATHEAAQCAYAKGEPTAFEARVRTADGRWQWVGATAKPVYHAGGAVAGWVSGWRDIEPEVRTREALREAEAMFRAAFEENPSILAILRPVLDDGGHLIDAQHVYLNRATRRLYYGDAPLEELVGTRIFERLPQFRDQLLSAYKEAYEQGAPIEHDVHGTRADGEFWSRVSVFPFAGGLVHVGRDTTPEMRAKIAVTESESRYRLLAENASDVVLLISLDGMLEWVSPSVVDLIGFSPDEIVGSRVADLTPPEDMRVVLAAQEALLHGETADFETRVRTAGGGWRWISATARPVYDESGTMIGRVSSWRDIDAQVAAREQGRGTAALLEAIFEGTTDAMFAKDLEGRYLIANRVAAQSLGRSVSDLLGKTDDSLFPLDDAAGIRADDRRVIASGKLVTLEEHVTFADGSRHWTTATKGPLRDAHGSVIGLVGVIRDTTEQREAEVRFRATLDRMLEGCMIIGPDWRALYANEAAARHAHVSRAEIEGEALFTVEPRIETTEIFARFRRCMDERSPERFEAPFTFASGATNWFSFSVEPVPEGIFVLSVDITEQRKTTEALRESEARLVEAQRLESVGRLAGGIAHDFNNLLMAINGTAELLAADTPPGDPRRPDVDAIAEAGRRAAALTSQLLAFGRRQVLHPTVVDLGEVLAETVPLLRRTLGEDIDLRVETAPGVGPVCVDRSQLEQVIVNLAFNARDAMPDGGFLTLGLVPTMAGEAVAARHAGVRPGPFVRLTVADTGTGIAPEIAERIFEPFFTTKSMGRGTGLGLATVQGIVAQSGGWIEVASERGNGTTFAVNLPVADGDAERQPVPLVAAVTGGSERVLLVEDEEPVRQVAARMLRDLGYKVTEMAGPYRALALDSATLSEVDLLVTDVVMPGLSGPRLDVLLRERHPGLRTVFISGFSPDSAIRDRLAVPGTAFLGKPFARGDLARVIRAVLDDAPASHLAQAEP